MGGTRARTPRGADARGLAERAHVKRKWLVGLTSVTSKRDLSSRRASEKPPHPLPRMSTRGFLAAACIWRSPAPCWRSSAPPVGSLADGSFQSERGSFTFYCF